MMIDIWRLGMDGHAIKGRNYPYRLMQITIT